MKISEIAKLIDGEIKSGFDNLDHKFEFALASDLMSDVLTVKQSNVLLITGLANIQAIRTAEMSDVHCIIVVRNKELNEEMIELAEECDITLIKCKYSMFKTVGILYDTVLKPLY